MSDQTARRSGGEARAVVQEDPAMRLTTFGIVRYGAGGQVFRLTSRKIPGSRRPSAMTKRIRTLLVFAPMALGAVGAALSSSGRQMSADCAFCAPGVVNESDNANDSRTETFWW
jgi:hypothetical protein